MIWTLAHYYENSYKNCQVQKENKTAAQKAHFFGKNTEYKVGTLLR